MSDRYRLDSRIATGGMGEVWRATDQVLGREVAVKLLKPEYADDPTFRSRFETEARNAAALHHPGVASVFDFGELPAEEAGGPPRPYLVMELVRGEPLSALLRSGHPMPAEPAAALVAQAADAIAAAHALGIVHRDVKPANLLVTPDRTVKITDFGIARAADAVALTQTGQVIGTPQYLSPEQAEGKPATEASDIYSLGVVLYECLAGRRPFVGDSPIATALAHLREPPPPLPGDVPEHPRRTVEVALAKDPAARFASAADLAEALRGGPVRAGAGSGAAGDDAPTAVAGAVPGAVGGAVAGAGLAGAGLAAAAGRDDDAARDHEGTRYLAPTPGDGAAGRDDGWAGRTTTTRTGYADDPRQPHRRTPGWVPWLVAAVAVLVVLLVISQLSGGDDETAQPSSPDSSSSSAAPTKKASKSASAKPTRKPSRTPSSSAPSTVTVNASDYVGRPADEAKKELQALGLKVKQTKVDNPTGEEEGTVSDVDPTGELQEGDTVTLSVYDKPLVETPSAPSGDESSSPAGGPARGPDKGPGGPGKGKR